MCETEELVVAFCLRKQLVQILHKLQITKKRLTTEACRTPSSRLDSYDR